MLAAGYFTTGECRKAAEHQVRIYMRQPGFTEGLIKGLARDKAELALLEFRDLLTSADITSQTENDAKDVLDSETAAETNKTK